MNETKAMINWFPHEPSSRLGSGYFEIPKSNAYVCRANGFLKIYPIDGGLLQVSDHPEISHLEGDLAPFSD